MSLQAAKIAEMVNGILHGNPDALVDDVSSLSQSRPGTLSFLSDSRETAQLAKSAASIVMIPKDCDAGKLKFDGEALIVTDDPFSEFISLLPNFREQNQKPEAGIHPSAVIDPTATIGEDVIIGPNVTIGAGSTIGNGCHLHAGVCIEQQVQLGKEVILYPRVVIYSNSQLKDRVIIHAGAVIGADGFGYQFKEGTFHKIEHYGCVILEEDVEVGACTTIDRGMFDPTVIGRGTKIDNQVMIAHNCRIGEHNVIVSQVGLAGSITTGNYCRFGGQVGIADHINIGEGASLMAKSGVFRDVEPGSTVLGVPALPQDQQKKIVMAQMKLPEMRQVLRKLEKRVTEIEKSSSTEESKVPVSLSVKQAPAA